eukprot:CAMPEP_0114636846 /NCGR_PEP_ID=MMETSP0168-20121206/17192_1 /TAXON_ID=95228 ORGANISM="Vannella sp., Strain DIVA3 517/6/12" /NCGR_SAMPLE_ID=MMETSP0168 /ASSEMBLY_ACC=CAM_ASM_000044 /LENGTH=260 /DNA_ID=CAMNT_0001848563 /DNA_START=44 /DNA_END=828 /DNA_ORIENTATION=+
MSERDQAEPVDLTDPSSDKEEEPVVDPTEYTVTRNGLELDETMAEITGEMWQGASALVRQSAQLQRQQNLTASAVAMGYDSTADVAVRSAVVGSGGDAGTELVMAILLVIAPPADPLQEEQGVSTPQLSPVSSCPAAGNAKAVQRALPEEKHRLDRSEAGQRRQATGQPKVLLLQIHYAKPLASPRSRGKRGKAIEQAKKAPKKASPTGKPSGRPSSSSSDEDLDINDVDLSGFDIRDGEDPEVAEASDDSDDDAFMEDV